MGQGWNAFSTLVPSSYVGLLFPSPQMLGIMGTAVFLIGTSLKGWNFFRSLHNRVLAQPVNGKKKKKKKKNNWNFRTRIIFFKFLSVLQQNYKGSFPFHLSQPLSISSEGIHLRGEAKLIGGKIEFVTPTSFSFHNHIDTRSYHKKIYKLPRLLIK